MTTINQKKEVATFEGEENVSSLSENTLQVNSVDLGDQDIVYERFPIE